MDHTVPIEDWYAAYKPLLFSLAYRMLGSVMDAEDIVQEAFLSLGAAADPAPIRNGKAYLCKIVTNRCIDRLRSGQAKREVYVGPWLPEPIVTPETDAQADPLQAYVRSESVSTAYLLLLQQLSWVERAVFLLREVLQYDYDEIAGIVGKSATNCRQIFHRAKRGISLRPPHDEEAAPVPGAASSRPADPERTGELVRQFVQALASGDIARLLGILSEDAVLYSDGGGKVHAATRPIVGADRVIRFLTGLLEKASPAFSFRFARVGSDAGIVTYENGVPQSVFSFHAENGRIAAVYIVVNPDKLAYVR
ncbi:RNA polymerase sigma-70 factor [Paenibacillus sp. GYB003]|uniref:RNA polymerase sigma-70 factor n=1 Tax=Paenibacillus sp. GYB003 TaxID=2994392 RepID=UPI002F96A875